MKENIIEFLAKHKVPYDQWTNNEYYSLDAVVWGVLSGQETLILRDGKVIRLTRTIDTKVQWQPSVLATELYELYQERHVSPCGTVQLIKHNGCLTDRILNGEQSEAAVRRCIRKNIGVEVAHKSKIALVGRDNFDQRIYPLPQYPGLHALDIRYTAHCNIQLSVYNPEGYSHEDCTGVTHYKWSKMSG